MATGEPLPQLPRIALDNEWLDHWKKKYNYDPDAYDDEVIKPTEPDTNTPDELNLSLVHMTHNALEEAYRDLELWDHLRDHIKSWTPAMVKKINKELAKAIWLYLRENGVWVPKYHGNIGYIDRILEVAQGDGPRKWTQAEINARSRRRKDCAQNTTIQDLALANGLISLALVCNRRSRFGVHIFHQTLPIGVTSIWLTGR